MDNRIDLLLADVKDIKQDVKALLQSSSVHNQILSQHEQRSTQLEERFQPIEAIYIFGAKSIVLIGVLAAVAGIIRVILGIMN
jgi:hypothetical protein